jgi:CheY-like chemotaxis protein
MLSLRAADKGLDLFCRIDPQVPISLKGDPGRVRQILTNLIGNAIKFTPQGEILISVSLVSERDELTTLMFEVRDTGIGIPAERQDAIFTPFTQLDGSTARKYGGTGLGLAICRQLAELMGGDIGLTSESGRGSTFWFTVPFGKLPCSTIQASNDADPVHADISGTSVLVVSSDPQGIITRHTVAEYSEHSIRILLAEDNIINQKVAQNLLNKLGYKSDVVADGQEAVLALELINYDLVLMDCMMPEMDGFAATAIIRNQASNVLNHAVPIIAMTANAMIGDREACLEAGMNDYLVKPVKKQELAEMIERWIRRSNHENSTIDINREMTHGTQ